MSSLLYGVGPNVGHTVKQIKKVVKDIEKHGEASSCLPLRMGVYSERSKIHSGTDPAST